MEANVLFRSLKQVAAKSNFDFYSELASRDEDDSYFEICFGYNK